MIAREIPLHAQAQVGSGPVVLRDIPDRSERRVLARPVAAAGKGVRPSSEPSTLGDATASAGSAVVRNLHSVGHGDPEVTHESIYEDARREGLAAGQASGLAEGREQGHAEGREEGRRQGIEQGLAEGRDAGAQEALQRTEAAHQAAMERITRLDQWCEALPRQVRAAVGARLQAAEEDMAALCHLVICRLLGEHALHPDNVVSGVRRAIEECVGETASRSALQGLLAVHLHPRDVALLQGDASMARWIEGMGGAQIPWVADERVELGGCTVHGTQGILDARLETQLSTLRETLLGLRQHVDPAATSDPSDAERDVLPVGVGRSATNDAR